MDVTSTRGGPLEFEGTPRVEVAARAEPARWLPDVGLCSAERTAVPNEAPLRHPTRARPCLRGYPASWGAGPRHAPLRRHARMPLDPRGSRSVSRGRRAACAPQPGRLPLPAERDGGSLDRRNSHDGKSCTVRTGRCRCRRRCLRASTRSAVVGPSRRNHTHQTRTATRPTHRHRYARGSTTIRGLE